MLAATAFGVGIASRLWARRPRDRGRYVREGQELFLFTTSR
jgi:hypothetical protein